MKFSVKDFLSKYDQIRSFLRIWSHLLKESLMENLILCAVRFLQSISTVIKLGSKFFHIILQGLKSIRKA